VTDSFHNELVDDKDIILEFKLNIISSKLQGEVNFNETTGYYMSGSNLYKTTDSGVNWTIQNTQINYWNHYNISFVNENTTNIENIITSISDRKLEKIVNIKGQETKPQPNISFIEIYDDGSTEKKLIIEK
jgi:hypothetical protein